MKKVLFLLTEPHPKNDALLKELKQQSLYNLVVIFISGRKKGYWNYTPDTNVATITTSAISFKLPMGYESVKIYLNFGLCFKLIKINPDILIIPGWDQPAYLIGLIYAKLFHKKIIGWIGSTELEKSWARILFYPYIQFLVRQLDSIVVYGSRARKFVGKLGVKQNKIFTAINTLDLDLFLENVPRLRNSKIQIKKKYQISEQFVILYVGQLIYRKGIDLLLQAFQKLSFPAALVIVGDGKMRHMVMQMSSEYKNIYYLQAVDRKRLPELYAIADVFVLPSRIEVWGLVVNEAMASGLPVVVSDKVGASADLVRHGENGFIIKSDSIEVLTDALIKCHSQPAVNLQMGIRNIKKIKKYGAKQMAQTFINVINFTQTYNK